MAMYRSFFQRQVESNVHGTHNLNATLASYRGANCPEHSGRRSLPLPFSFSSLARRIRSRTNITVAQTFSRGEMHLQFVGPRMR